MANDYLSKKRTPSEAAALVRSRDTLAFPLGPGQPSAFLQALGDRDDWEELVAFGALLLAPYALFFRKGVRLLSGFYGPVERLLRSQGYAVEFVPADFRRYSGFARRLSPRVMATVVAPSGPDGRFSLSLHAGATVDELRRAGADPERLLVVEVNPRLPRTLGIEPDHPHSLSLEEIDVIVESDVEPPTLPDSAPTEIEKTMAEIVSGYVPDGATLQTGIGGVPSMVVEMLAGGKGGDYGVHSEMFTTGLMRLHHAGKVTNRKGLYDGVSICTFALGTEELHRWLDGQQAVRFLPVDCVNDPSLIARNREMISINGALAVDLFGQISADTIGGRQFSGIGGHEDFINGASFSLKGHSIVCLPSTATVDGRAVSRLVARFGAGALVTTPRHQIDIIVTEYGAAEVAGLTVRERAHAIAEIAHPDFRDELREQARDLTA